MNILLFKNDDHKKNVLKGNNTLTSLANAEKSILNNISIFMRNLSLNVHQMLIKAHIYIAQTVIKYSKRAHYLYFELKYELMFCNSLIISR